MRVVNLNAMSLTPTELMAKGLEAVSPIKLRTDHPSLFLQKWAEEGASVARRIYMSTNLDVWHPIDVTVEVHGNNATITASGPEVGFVEFGTGINNREWAGNGGLSYTPPPHGSYGKQQGADPDGWWFFDPQSLSIVHTTGMQPAEAMLEAWFKLVSVYPSVGREVFESAGFSQ